MNAVVEQPLQGEVYRPSRMLDPSRFQYLWELSEHIVSSSLVPDSIKMEGSGAGKKPLPEKTVLANVFAVVEQADRWNISPFALIQGASIVHGKLCFEGKIISGVLEALLGIRLTYKWSGEGEQMKVVVSGQRPGDPQPVTIEGSVADWKTTGNGSPWVPKAYPRQLAYRGAREWTRIWESAIIIGVFSDDEMMQVAYEAAAMAARPVQSLGERLARGDVATAQDGFSRAGAQQALEDKRQVPMDAVQPREKERVPAEKTAEAKPATQPKEAQQERRPDQKGAEQRSNDKPSAATETTAGAGQPDQESSDQADGADFVFSASDYATRLRRAVNSETTDGPDKKVGLLKHYASTFWATHGGWPAKDEAVRASASKIYRLCEEAIEGKINPKQLNESLQEVISG